MGQKPLMHKAVDNAANAGMVKQRPWIRPVSIIVAVIVVLAVLGVGTPAAYARWYRDRVYPGVTIGTFYLGSMTRQQTVELIENFNTRLAKEGVRLYVTDANGQRQYFNQSVLSTNDSSVELISVDSEQVAQIALNYGRSGSWWRQWLLPLEIRWQGRAVLPPVFIDSRFMDSVKSQVAPFEDKPHNATIRITSVAPLRYDTIPEQSGSIFDHEQLQRNIHQMIGGLFLEDIAIQRKQFIPAIIADDITEPVIAQLPAIFSYGSIRLTHVDPHSQRERMWDIEPAVYSQWLTVKRDTGGKIVVGFQEEKVGEYLETLRPLIDVPSQSAKFVMDDMRVKEFQASRYGVGMDENKTYALLDALVQARAQHATSTTSTVAIAFDVVKPDVEVRDVNDLGISDIIGVGYSTFKDSKTNRIKNIALAVKKLNGVLIKPGEEFSTIKAAGPFTAASGYVPEMVIKGKEIKPEVGGGMCQIGTTLFRMAMNSGMPIAQRRNHSLVVGYYADPVNGNPGTDATVYEPFLDFKFLNDTGNYILVQTHIDYQKQQLTFTLWGKNDGRKGWYTHPTISRWIPAGEPEEIKVTTLPPGEKKCQNAFRGAVAKFTYTRITPSGEKIDRVFESYYRPLPRICMVGVAPEEEPTPAPQMCSEAGCAPLEEPLELTGT